MSTKYIGQSSLIIGIVCGLVLQDQNDEYNLGGTAP
jgi:hypothetical protein